MIRLKQLIILLPTLLNRPTVQGTGDLFQVANLPAKGAIFKVALAVLGCVVLCLRKVDIDVYKTVINAKTISEKKVYNRLLTGFVFPFYNTLLVPLKVMFLVGCALYIGNKWRA